MAAKTAKHRELKAIGNGVRFPVADGRRIISIFVMTVDLKAQLEEIDKLL